MNRLIIFDLEGTIAHFRKFYTNSSSLSYAFPPRTTITGLIAGIMGYESDRFGKNTYYELFNLENCKIALSIKNPVRKIVQTINYIRTKELKEITGSGGHTQIPVEFILPVKLGETLKYRIYFFHKDGEIMNKLLNHLLKNCFVYPPYLGITECPCRVIFVDVCENYEVKDLKNQQKVKVNTVIPIRQIQGLPDFIPGYKFMKEDRVPVEFNSKRMITKIGSYIYEKDCKPITINVKDKVFKIIYKDGDKEITEHVIFME